MPFQKYQGNTVNKNDGNLNDDNNNPNLNRNQALIMYGIVRGIFYLNRMNLYHRDLKPQNIVINDLYRPYIADFGMSKGPIKHFTINSEKRVGTILYEAPDLNDFWFNHQEKKNNKKSNLFKRYKFMQPLKRMRNRKNNGYIFQSRSYIKQPRIMKIKYLQTIKTI